jgi:hypothetical protein
VKKREQEREIRRLREENATLKKTVGRAFIKGYKKAIKFAGATWVQYGGSERFVEVVNAEEDKEIEEAAKV